MGQNDSPALTQFEARYYRAELACTALSDLMNNGEDTPSVSAAWAEIAVERDRMRHQMVRLRQHTGLASSGGSV
jgi:hypothetical protein